MDRQLLAIILVSLGALGWSVRDVLGKTSHSPSPFLTLAATSAGGIILNFGVMLSKQCAGFGCVDKLTPRTIAWLFARCIGAVGGCTLNFMALKHLDLALSTMIHCSAPLFIVVLGCVLLNERVKPLAVICIVVALIGMVLDIQPWNVKSSAKSSMLGLLLAFAGSVCSAFAYISLRALSDLSSTTTLLAFYVSGLTFGICVLMFEGFDKPSASLLRDFAGISLATYVSEVLITKGYAFATKGAGSVAVFKFLTPVFSIVFDILVYHKIPNLYSVIGAALVVSSSALMVKIQSHSPDPASSSAKSTALESDDESESESETENVSARSPVAGESQ